jgi:hypothetical protein
VKPFLKYGVLLIGMFWIMVFEVYAFSIGELHVKSKFGDKFDASFKIELDFDGPVEVGLGDSDDYAKLGLEKQDVIDGLILDSPQPASVLKRTLQIHSNNPLFFPSLNLVVWATHNGGTLLENFLVTVDFQQSLALNVRGKKKNTSPKELPKYEPGPAVSPKTVPLPNKREQVVKDESVVKKQQEANLVNRRPEAPDGQLLNEERLPLKSIAPIPIKTEVTHRRRLSGVMWANPRPNPDLAAMEIKKSGGAQSLSTAKGIYILQKGESLLSVARKLKEGKYHPAQIAAAIWMNNINKFIFGNIHGIRAGAELDLNNLEEHLTNIDLKAARNILKNQAVEWKLTKSATSVHEEVLSISEIPLPSERLEDLANLFEQVREWQDTWEKMDIEGHLAYYQVLETENPFLINKKLLLARYPKPQLETSSKFLVLKEGAPVVCFTQALSSENSKSWGLKELEWTRSSSGWKIREEIFFEWFSHSGEQSLENYAGSGYSVSADRTLSFVIHVSSHSNKTGALSLTNQLRKNGFDAYWAPFRMSMDTFIYRVYVGRFSDWNQAHRVVRILRKKPFGGHATVIPYSLALKVGEPDSLQDARMILESLRKAGLSGLLLVSYTEPLEINFRVVVGAFKKAYNATWMLQQLKQFGFAGELISP